MQSLYRRSSQVVWYIESAKAGGVELDRQKIDEDLGGRPLLHRTVELFNKLQEVGAIIVAGPADHAASANSSSGT